MIRPGAIYVLPGVVPVVDLSETAQKTGGIDTAYLVGIQWCLFSNNRHAVGNPCAVSKAQGESRMKNGSKTITEELDHSGVCHECFSGKFVLLTTRAVTTSQTGARRRKQTRAVGTGALATGKRRQK